MVQVDNEEEGNPGSLENNGLTSLLSVYEEDNSGMLSEPCMLPSLHKHLVTFLICYIYIAGYDGIITYMAYTHKQTATCLP